MRVISTAAWVFVVAAAWQSLAVADAPRHVYLTWQGDTSTTMTVTFQSEQPFHHPRVYFDTRSRNGIRDDYAHSLPAESTIFEGPRHTRYIHTVELTTLQSATAYYFVAGDASGDICRELKFRTIPEGDAPIRFVTGGDMNVVRQVGDLLAQAGKHDPMFGLIGGDLAYANGDLRNYRKWDRWLDLWAENFVTPDGFMVPMVLGIGNHEVEGSYNQTADKAPFYFGYFPQGGNAHYSRTFGDNLAIISLDTGHITTHEAQAPWLEEQLKQFQDVPNLFAIYHVPLYPSHRDFMSGSMIAGRTHWAPLFDKYHLDVAFENHDHTLKRTPRIKANRINPEGTLYLGDGCFGVEPRVVDQERRWYEEVAQSVLHFWLVETTADRATFTAIGVDGKTLDKTQLP